MSEAPSQHDRQPLPTAADVDETQDRQTKYERRLWATVLAHGLYMAARGDREDIMWVFDDDTHIGSFRFICSELEMNPDELRKQLQDNWDCVGNKRIGRLINRT